MTTVPATVVALAALSSAGLLPALSVVGLRVVTIPLLPLVGAIFAALAATCFMAAGGSLIAWFVALAPPALWSSLLTGSAGPNIVRGVGPQTEGRPARRGPGS